MTGAEPKAHVAIVGAGPAGLMAAVEARRRGCRVSLFDEAPRPGGQIYRQAVLESDASPVGLAAELARKRRVLAAFDAVAAGIEVHAEATVHSLFPGPELQAVQAGRALTLRPDAVVLATGVGERAVPFPGWTLPGVMYAGGVQALLKSQNVRAGDRVAVAGLGPLPLAVAAQLAEAGAEVVCVALARPLSLMARRPLGLWAGRQVVREGLAYRRTLRRARVPVLNGWVPLRAEGERRVEGLVLGRLDSSGGLAGGAERRFAADLVALNFGFTANSELARMAGAESIFDLARGGWLPVADDVGRTTVARVFVAGDGAGLRGAWVATAEGRIVGAAAAAEALGTRPDGTLRAELAEAFAERRRHTAFQAAVRETLMPPPGLWDLADAETLVCRCEGVTRARVEEALAGGHRGLDGLKRNTRAGMGWCGGRTCLAYLAALAGESEPMRARPVARPVPLGALIREDQP